MLTLAATLWPVACADNPTFIGFTLTFFRCTHIAVLKSVSRKCLLYTNTSIYIILAAVLRLCGTNLMFTKLNLVSLMDYKFIISKLDNNNKSFVGLTIYKGAYAFMSSTRNILFSLCILVVFPATASLMLKTDYDHPWKRIQQ